MMDYESLVFLMKKTESILSGSKGHSNAFEEAIGIVVRSMTEGRLPGVKVQLNHLLVV